jgi:hypothetical protein
VTNPNGANQYKEDPRQKLCWELYINPKSKSFSNGYRSALAAGYEDSTATLITTEDWFIEKHRKEVILKKAENNLDKLLSSEDEKIQADMTKFALSTLGKKVYSSRIENTGADGKDLIPTPLLANVRNDDGTLKTTET